jgi:hypothetical protein
MKGSGILCGRWIESKQREKYTFLKLLKFLFQIYKTLHSFRSDYSADHRTKLDNQCGRRPVVEQMLVTL